MEREQKGIARIIQAYRKVSDRTAAAMAETIQEYLDGGELPAERWDEIRQFRREALR